MAVLPEAIKELTETDADTYTQQWTEVGDCYGFKRKFTSKSESTCHCLLSAGILGI